VWQSFEKISSETAKTVGKLEVKYFILFFIFLNFIFTFYLFLFYFLFIFKS